MATDVEQWKPQEPLAPNEPVVRSSSSSPTGSAPAAASPASCAASERSEESEEQHQQQQQQQEKKKEEEKGNEDEKNSEETPEEENVTNAAAAAAVEEDSRNEGTAPSVVADAADDDAAEVAAAAHATNLLHEAVEQRQKQHLEEQQRQQEHVHVNPNPETVQSEAPIDAEDVKNKNIPDLYDLFTNDKLKEQPLTAVLNSDPFCIPRLTDNVPEYRPAFNPLSILEAEEKLLPRYFRLDPYEGIPDVAEKGGKNGRNGSSSDPRALSQSEKSVRDRATMSSIPIRSKSVGASGAATFIGKTSTFMGTLPRQSEFSEIPVSDTIFQTQQTFRPSPPPSHPSYASKNIHMTTAKEWEPPSASMSASSPESIGPATLNDAIFLTSLHQSGSHHPQHHQVAANHHQSHHHAYKHVDHQLLDYYAGKDLQQPHHQQQQQQHYQQQQQPQGVPLGGHEAQSDKLMRYLPMRTPSDRSPYTDESPYLAHPANDHMNHNNNGHAANGMFSDYLDDATMGSSSYGPGSSQPMGSNQSLQPIPKKPRSKNIFRPCTAPGCTKGARGKSGLCQKHGGGKRCATANCNKGAQGSSAMCLFHGGGYRCTVDGCTTGARGTSGLCAKHGGYKRSKEPGSVASPASSSGKRSKTQHSPMGFEDHGSNSMGGTPGFDSVLY